MKSDSDQSIEGDGKRRDCIKKNYLSVGFLQFLTGEEKFLAGWIHS